MILFWIMTFMNYDHMNYQKNTFRLWGICLGGFLLQDNDKGYQLKGMLEL